MTYQCLDRGFQLPESLESGFLLTAKNHGKEMHGIEPVQKERQKLDPFDLRA